MNQIVAFRRFEVHSKICIKLAFKDLRRCGVDAACRTTTPRAVLPVTATSSGRAVSAAMTAMAVEMMGVMELHHAYL